MTTEGLDTRAAELGATEGRGAASWLTAMDEATAYRCLKLDNDGDPEWSDIWGPFDYPLSGQYADQRTTSTLLEDLDVPEDERDAEYCDVFDAYETAFFDAYRDELIEAAITHVAFDVWSRLDDGAEWDELDELEQNATRAFLTLPSTVRIPGSLATKLEGMGVKGHEANVS